MMTSPGAGAARPQGGEINISMALTEIISEICSLVPSFSHIDTGKIQVCISSNRNNGRGATFGKLVPLRFKGGEELLYFRGKCYAMPRCSRTARGFSTWSISTPRGLSTFRRGKNCG